DDVATQRDGELETLDDLLVTGGPAQIRAQRETDIASDVGHGSPLFGGHSLSQIQCERQHEQPTSRQHRRAGAGAGPAQAAGQRGRSLPAGPGAGRAAGVTAAISMTWM